METNNDKRLRNPVTPAVTKRLPSATPDFRNTMGEAQVLILPGDAFDAFLGEIESEESPPDALEAVAERYKKRRSRNARGIMRIANDVEVPKAEIRSP